MMFNIMPSTVGQVAADKCAESRCKDPHVEGTQEASNKNAEVTHKKYTLHIISGCIAMTALAIAAIALFVVLARTDSNTDQNTSSQTVIVIGGVPVHNYHRRHLLNYYYPDNYTTIPQSSLRGNPVYDWILQFKGSPDGDEVYELCTELPSNAKCVFEGHPSMGGVPMVILRATRSGLESALTKHSDLLDHAEADVGMESTGSADATELPWGLDRIDARSGLDGSYKSSATGRGIHVYVVDTGINFAHDEFANEDGTSRAVPAIEVLGKGVVECDQSDMTCAADDHAGGHGTHVAGTVGGKHYGVAKDVVLHSVKAVNESGKGKLSWFIEALDWIAVHGQRPAIISASLGARAKSPSTVHAVNMTVSAGVTVVAGAGNDASDACEFTPAEAPMAITVGATDQNDTRPYWSNYGKCLDIFAPGVQILSAGVGSNQATAVKTGTSMATPHVSGAAALLLERDPSLSPAGIANELRNRGTYDVVSGARDSDNILLYTGNLPPMSTIATTTTITTTLLVQIRAQGGEGCLQAAGPEAHLIEGASNGCAKFRVASIPGNQLFTEFASLDFPGQCLETVFIDGWILKNCRDVHNQKLKKAGEGFKWCIEDRWCVEAVPGSIPTTSSTTSTTPAPFKFIHVYTEGQCSDHPGWRSATREECVDAARRLGKAFAPWNIQGSKGLKRASGCLWNRDWKVRYNEVSESTKPCGSLKRSCICVRA